MNKNTYSALLIAISTSMISTNDAILKVSSEDLGVGQLLFIRGLFAILVFSLIIKLTGRNVFSKSILSKINIQRAVCECVATFFFVASLSYLSIATASTLVWTTPIWLTLCSAIFLHEYVSVKRWMAVGIGFAGVLLIANPFSDGFSWAMVMPLCTAGFVVVRDLLTRQLGDNIHSVHVVLTALLTVTLTAGVVSLFQWHEVALTSILWLGVSSCLLSIGFYLQINAIRLGELSFIAPFLFTSIPVAVFWGFVIWHDIPSVFVLIGISLIIASGLYILVDKGKFSDKRVTLEPH